jgi:hypothetical protein
MKQFKFLLLFILMANFTQAQSPFKRMPKPEMRYGISLAAAPVSVTAWRFTGPIAGFMYPQNQVVTGLGYGYNRMHFVDSTQHYYVDISVSGVVLAGGNVTPSFQANNIMSAGIGIGFVNQLIQIIPCYNFASPNNTKGSFGVVVAVAVPL